MSGGIIIPHALLSGAGSAGVSGSGGIATRAANVHGTGTVGRPGPEQLLCYIAGKSSILKIGTTTIDNRMGSRGTSAFTITSPNGYSPLRPLVGQEVKFRDRKSGRVEFCGQIDKIREYTEPGTTEYIFECSATDLSGRLDVRTVTKSYGPDTVANIVKDAVSTFLTGEHVTTYHVTSTASIPAEMKFAAKTFTEFMNDICGVSGDMWFVDEYNDLNCFAPGAGGDAPFSITDTNSNVRDFSVITTLIGYGNNVFVRTDDNLGVEAAL